METLDLTPLDHAQIERLAELERTSRKDALMGAVRRRLSELAPEPVNGSDVLVRLRTSGALGSFDGPEDLSANKAHLEGFGE